jgi:hypothetical protein
LSLSPRKIRHKIPKTPAKIEAELQKALAAQRAFALARTAREEVLDDPTADALAGRVLALRDALTRARLAAW